MQDVKICQKFAVSTPSHNFGRLYICN